MKTFAVLLVIVLAVMMVAPIAPANARKHPMNVIQYRYFSTQASLFTALLTPDNTGGIDIMDVPLTQAEYLSVMSMYSVDKLLGRYTQSLPVAAQGPSGALSVTVRSGSHTFSAWVCYFYRDVATMGFPFQPTMDLEPYQQDSRTGHQDDLDRLGGYPTGFDMGYYLDGEMKHITIGPDPPLQMDTWYTLPDPPLQENAEVQISLFSAPPIQVCPAPEAGEYELAFNNNWTDGIQMDRRSPMNFTDFRNALNCLVDKNGVIAGPTLGGFAFRDDTQIPQPLMSGYVNPAVAYPNYPWEFNVTHALQILYNGGWYNHIIYPTFSSLLTIYFDGTLNSTAGTDHGVVYSGNDPYGQWGGGDPQATANAALANIPLAPLIGYVRSDDARKDLGDMFCAELTAIGCPYVENYKATYSALRPFVFDAQLYDFATLGYTFTAPPDWWYSELTPAGTYPGGPNCYLVDDTNMTFWAYAASTAPTQSQYMMDIMNVQDILVMQSELVSVYSPASYNAYKTGMLGMIDELGYSFGGDIHSQLLNWIFLNCRKNDTIRYDGPPENTPASNIIYYGCLNPPDMVNPIFSNTLFDSEVEDEIFSYPLAINPYNTIVPGSAITGAPYGGDLPWMAYAWKTELINDPNNPSNPQWTNVTFWFRHDISWHDSVPFTVDDVNYTIYINALYGDSWDHNDMMLCVNPTTYVPHFQKWDDWTCSIQVSSPSWLNLYLCNIPILPKHLYQYVMPNDLDAAKLGYSMDGLHGLWPGQAAVSGNILPGAPFTLSQLNNNPETTLVGTGPWKYRVGSTDASQFVAGSGITLDAYAGFFLSIAPGATAFRYTWLPGPMPQGGYYKVGLVDLVYVAHAYGTTGSPPSTVPINGVPGAPHTWNPACDMAAPSCIIGLTDLVTLALHYGWYYGNYSYNAPYPPSEIANGGP